MKIFGWLRKEKHNRRDESISYSDKLHRPNCNEEFSDWPSGLLSIGTFGDSSFKHGEDSNVPGELGKGSLPAEKLSDSDCLSEADDDEEDGESEISSPERQSSTVSVVRTDKKGGISKKSLSFLVKKVLLCRGGFVPTAPFARDHKADSSRMEKILKAMLHKKIYPQRPNPIKYLDTTETERDKRGAGEESKKSKWVKTDSEYIVLEI